MTAPQGSPRSADLHDLEAERSVLSALLLDASAIGEIGKEVCADDFCHPAHGTRFRAMVSLQGAGQPVDLVTLADFLATRKLLNSIGGPVFLAEIADFEATAAHVVHHARIVRRRALERRARDIYTRASCGEPIVTRLSDVEPEAVERLGSRTSRSELRS